MVCFYVAPSDGVAVTGLRVTGSTEDWLLAYVDLGLCRSGQVQQLLPRALNLLRTELKHVGLVVVGIKSVLT